MSIYNNATPGCCCVCGVRASRNLCRKCRIKYSNINGKLPQWLRDTQNEQQQQGARERYNRQRLARGQHVRRHKGGGRPQIPGVEFVSLEQLQQRERRYH